MTLYAEIIEHADRRVLIYIEDHPDLPVLHVITTVGDFAQADLNFKIDKGESEIWELFSQNDFEMVRELLDREVVSLERTLTNE